MRITIKSSVYLTPKKLRGMMQNACPLKLFQHINLVNDETDGLCYAYRIPSKLKLSGMKATMPVGDDFLQYLIDNELSLEGVADQRFMIDAMRNLNCTGLQSLKQFAASLPPEKAKKYGMRLGTIADSINKQCTPTMIPSILEHWKEFRGSVYDQLDHVKI